MASIVALALAVPAVVLPCRSCPPPFLIVTVALRSLAERKALRLETVPMRFQAGRLHPEHVSVSSSQRDSRVDVLSGSKMPSSASVFEGQSDSCGKDGSN